MKKKMTEKQIDEIVIAQAEDDSAWEEPVDVQRDGTEMISIPSDIAARAAFLAHLHRAGSVESWLEQVIRERIAFEEAAFSNLKQAMAERE